MPRVRSQVTLRTTEDKRRPSRAHRFLSLEHACVVLSFSTEQTLSLILHKVITHCLIRNENEPGVRGTQSFSMARRQVIAPQALQAPTPTCHFGPACLRFSTLLYQKNSTLTHVLMRDTNDCSRRTPRLCFTSTQGTTAQLPRYVPTTTVHVSRLRVRRSIRLHKYQDNAALTAVQKHYALPEERHQQTPRLRSDASFPR